MKTLPRLAVLIPIISLLSLSTAGLFAQQTTTGPIVSGTTSLGTILQADGYPSAGGTFAGTYSSGTTYHAYQTVTSAGADWICLSTCLAVTPAAAAAGSPQLWAPFDTSGAGLAATQADIAFFAAWGQVQACSSSFTSYCSISLIFGSSAGGYTKNGDWIFPTNTFGYTISLFGQGRGQTWIHQTASTLNYMVNSTNVNSSGGQTISGMTLDANLLAGGCLSHHLRRSLISDVACWNPQQQSSGTIGAAMWLGQGADAYESLYTHLLVRSPTYSGLVAAYGTASVTAGAITSITWGGTGTNLNLPVTAGPGLVAYFMGKGATSTSWKPCGTMPVVSSIALTGGAINTSSGVGGFTFTSAGATCGGTIYVRVQASGTLNEAFYFNGSDSTAEDIVTSGDFKVACEYTNGPNILIHEHPYCAAPYQIEATGGYQDHVSPELDSPIQYGIYMGGTGGTVIQGPMTEFNAGNNFGAGDFLIDAASGTITIEGSGCYPGSPQNFGGYAKFTGTGVGPMTPANMTPALTTSIIGQQQNCDGTSTLWGTYPAGAGITAAQISSILNTTPQSITVAELNGVINADSIGLPTCSANLNYIVSTVLAGSPGKIEMSPNCGALSAAVTLGTNQHIYAKPGSYAVSAAFTLGQNDSIQCDPASDISGSGIGACVFTQANSTNLANIFILNGTDAALSNITIDGNKANNSSGGNNIEIIGLRDSLSYVSSINAKTNNIAIGNGSSNIAAVAELDHVASLSAGNDGINCSITSDIWITNSQIENNGNNGITLTNCGAAHVIDDDVSGATLDGISISGSSTAAVSGYNNVINNTTLSQNGHHDIEIQGWDAAHSNYSSLYNQIVGDLCQGSSAHAAGNTYDCVKIQDSGFNTITGLLTQDLFGTSFEFKAGIEIVSVNGELADQISGGNINVGSTTPIIAVADTNICGNTVNGIPSACSTGVPVTIYSAAGTPLPSCVTTLKGKQLSVSDATSPTYLGTYTSGGAVTSPVMCNGTNWLTY